MSGGGRGFTPAWTQEEWDAKFLPGSTGQLGWTPPAAAGAPSYSPINPAPQPGQGPFGKVPGPVALPDPAGDLNKALGGNLGALNSGASSSILSKLRGQLSPETQNMIQDASARFGIMSGMPGAGLQRARTARDLGRTSEDLQSQGVAELNPFLANTAHTQTVSPETQIGLAEQNALNAAAPDPSQAAAYAQQLFNQYLAMMASRGGGRSYAGPAGGTGSFPMQGGGGGGAGWGMPAQMPQQSTAPSFGGTGAAPNNSAPWYDPTLSDENQWNQMFPDEPWNLASQAPDFPQYNSDIENWQNSSVQDIGRNYDPNDPWSNYYDPAYRGGYYDEFNN